MSTNSPQNPEDDDRLHQEAADLLCQVAKGDSVAFGEIYDRFSGALLALCLTMLADRAEAEDALQEVFLTVWSRAKLYDPALGKAVSWLMAVARNKCLDRLRSSKRKLAGLDKIREELEPQPTPESGSPLASQEKQDMLNSALDQLSVPQRKAIEMAFLKGYTQVEVADLLDEPLGTVKARIRRGMLQMRELLDEADETPDASKEDEIS